MTLLDWSLVAAMLAVMLAGLWLSRGDDGGLRVDPRHVPALLGQHLHPGRGDAVDDGGWLAFWKAFVGIHAVLAVIVTVWLGAGGLRDVRAMLGRLRTMGRTDKDDGFVRHPNERT